MKISIPEARPRCPHCGGAVERIARRWIDRVVSMVMPVRRYRCHALACGWEGRLRVRRDAGASREKRYDRRIDPP